MTIAARTGRLLASPAASCPAADFRPASSPTALNRAAKFAPRARATP